MTDINDMTTRERTAGLMRGSRKQMQLGYTAKNAAYAALRYERGFSNETAIDDPELVNDLFPYAEGFADGMADALEGFPTAQPVAAMMADWEHVEYMRNTDDPEYVRTPAYEEGRALAAAEFPADMYPALDRRPEPDLIQRFPERPGTGAVTRAEPGWANATDEELKAEAERRARENV